MKRAAPRPSPPLPGAGEVTDSLRATLLLGGDSAEEAGGLAIPVAKPARVHTKQSSLSAALGLGSTPK